MILLVGINAKYIHSNLGIYCIESYARKKGITDSQLCMAEYTINQSVDYVMADIYEKKPDMIAFSCYIWNIDFIVNLSRELHKVSPEVALWYGGPEVSFDAIAQLERYPWITGIIEGEGEETFYEVAKLYIEGREEQLSKVKGITFRDGDNIIKNVSRPRMELDDVVFPYYDRMDNLANRIVYYETSRGCPYGCSYCLSSVEKNVRFRSMELVRKELKFFIDAKVPQVKFVDRTFNCNHEHTMEIWKFINENDNGITNFHFELSADLLTDKEIEYVNKFRPGLVQFEIGVQTANSDTLREIHRNPDLTTLKENVAKVHKYHNIHQHLDLIAGLPYEDYDSFRNSFNTVYEMEPDQLQLGFLKVLKGSPIYESREKYGIVFHDTPPYEVMYTKWISYEDILHLKRIEDMVERYYNSMQFQASVKFCTEKFETPFDFFESIGRFYHVKGYEGVHQSRLQNYDILIEFSENKKDIFSKEDMEILKQLLVFDLYARENLKKRPDFAESDKIPEKEIMYNFYKKEAENPIYLKGYDGYDWKQILRMTHMEIFDYDIPEYIENNRLVKEKCVVLFDYNDRNPLDNQAKMIKIDL